MNILQRRTDHPKFDGRRDPRKREVAEEHARALAAAEERAALALAAAKADADAQARRGAGASFESSNALSISKMHDSDLLVHKCRLWALSEDGFELFSS